ncbi:MAG: hypothetical protein ABSC55_21215 [Syntrophorhabdales bacterium]|jgi:alanine dehydrogenase
MEDLNTDIVIAGYGFAEAVVAVVAHDLGAKVLIVERNGTLRRMLHALRWGDHVRQGPCKGL